MATNSQLDLAARVLRRRRRTSLSEVARRCRVTERRARELVLDCMRQRRVEGCLDDDAGQFVAAEIELRPSPPPPSPTLPRPREDVILLEADDDENTTGSTPAAQDDAVQSQPSDEPAEHSRPADAKGNATGCRSAFTLLFAVGRLLAILLAGFVAGLIGYLIALPFGDNVIALCIAGGVAGLIAFACGVVIQLVGMGYMLILGASEGVVRGIVSALLAFLDFPRISVVIPIGLLAIGGGVLCFWLHGPLLGAVIVALAGPALAAIISLSPYSTA
jgi:hypothetical protein